MPNSVLNDSLDSVERHWLRAVSPHNQTFAKVSCMQVGSHILATEELNMLRLKLDSPAVKFKAGYKSKVINA